MIFMVFAQGGLGNGLQRQGPKLAGWAKYCPVWLA
jgi:hypothetical protein